VTYNRMAVSLSGLRRGLASFRREENEEDFEDEAYKVTIKTLMRIILTG